MEVVDVCNRTKYGYSLVIIIIIITLCSLMCMHNIVCCTVYWTTWDIETLNKYYYYYYFKFHKNLFCGSWAFLLTKNSY